MSTSHLKAITLFLVVLIADCISKFLVQAYIPYSTGGISIFHWGIQFSIVHETNRGAAWGLFSYWQTGLLYFRLIVVSMLAVYVLFLNKKKSWELPLTLVLAGALGNILDTFLYGHVVDMLHFTFWGFDYPVFNLADSAICIGIGWLFLLSWLEKPNTEKPHTKSKQV